MPRRLLALPLLAGVVAVAVRARRRPRPSKAWEAVDRAVRAGELTDLEDEVLASWHRNPVPPDPLESTLARRRAIGHAYLRDVAARHPDRRH